ncbi:hypothetical protein [Plantactinospora sp. BC1]|uniref:hypothetical protein n=1 Tax=Plantactinospora sp. BC1 TaxID=2108470 RepID=UPI00131EFDA7|nr:hypothetical protein [Plantactinospora sp. BC1]
MSTVNSMPCSTASREQAELMIPLPPTKRTLRALMPPPPVLAADPRNAAAPADPESVSVSRPAEGCQYGR